LAIAGVVGVSAHSVREERVAVGPHLLMIDGDQASCSESHAVWTKTALLVLQVRYRANSLVATFPHPYVDVLGTLGRSINARTGA
jgi:hypothetical protein